MRLSQPTASASKTLEYRIAEVEVVGCVSLFQIRGDSYKWNNYILADAEAEMTGVAPKSTVSKMRV